MSSNPFPLDPKDFYCLLYNPAGFVIGCYHKVHGLCYCTDCSLMGCKKYHINASLQEDTP